MYKDMIIRPRRLRDSESIRKMVRETRISKEALVYPFFVKEGKVIGRGLVLMRFSEKRILNVAQG